MVIIELYKEGGKNKRRRCFIEKCMFFGFYLDYYFKRYKEVIFDNSIIKLLIKRVDVDEKEEVI